MDGEEYLFPFCFIFISSARIKGLRHYHHPVSEGNSSYLTPVSPQDIVRFLSIPTIKLKDLSLTNIFHITRERQGLRSTLNILSRL